MCIYFLSFLGSFFRLPPPRHFLTVNFRGAIL